ncbi:MAG: Ig-like domain-containing protein [archaeon]
MVDYHYIKRGGKTYGPYYYRSYRVGSQVKKEYLGKNFVLETSEQRKKPLVPFFIFAALLCCLFFFLLYQPALIGKASISLGTADFKANEQISGSLDIQLKQGELLPEKTEVKVEISNSTFSTGKSIKLKELVSGDYGEYSNNFYIENVVLGGNGKGFGLIGAKQIQPFIYFKIEINALDEAGTEITQIIDASATAAQQYVYALDSIGNSTPLANIEAIVQEDSAYYYDEEGKKNNIPIQEIAIEKTESQIIASASFSYIIEGFGSDFLLENTTVISLNLSSFNLAVENPGEYNFDVSLSYENVEIMKVSSPVSILLSNITANRVPYLVQEIPDIILHANENTSINLRNYFYDENGDAITFTSTQPENVNVKILSGIAEIVPEHNFVGALEIKFNASDSQSENESNAVQIEFENSPPVQAREIADMNITRNRNEEINLAYYFEDADNDALAFSSTQPENITVSISGSTAVLQPDENFVGSRTIIFHASDGINVTQSNQIGIEVAMYSINHFPVQKQTIQNITINKSSTESINLADYFEDADSEQLIYNISKLPEGNIDVLLNSTTGAVEIVPEINWIGNRSIVFSAADSASFVESNLVEIFVVETQLGQLENMTNASINHAPVLVYALLNMSIMKNSNATINLSGYFYDADNDNLIFMAFPVENITVSFSGSTASIMPGTDFEGTRILKIYASDGINITESNPFIAEIAGVKINNPPVLIMPIPNITIRADSAYTLDLSAFFNDSDSDLLQFLGQTENITLNITGSIAELIPDSNFTGTSALIFDASDGINVTQSNDIIVEVKFLNITDTVTQQRAVIGKPVKWSRKIVLAEPSSVTVTVPIDAVNLSVEEVTKENQKNVEASIFTLTGAAVKIAESEKSIWEYLSDFFRGIFSRIGITGYAVADDSAILEDEVQKLKDAGFKEMQINLEGNATEYNITYETPAPAAEEFDLGNGRKQIIVSGPETVHYTDILAFTELPEIVPVGKENAINLYNIKNDSRENVNFTAYDSDTDGMIDMIEWNVPHLSNETYETSITIFNVQSYPTLYGNWSVYFNTTGTADLTITAINSTTWTETGNCGGKTCQLRFVKLVCGETEFNYTWLQNSGDGSNNSVFYSNYSCNLLSFEEVQVLGAEHHTLKFTFGNETAYALNEVTPPTVTLISPASGTITTYDNATFKFQASDNVALANCSLHTNRTGAWQRESSNTTAIANDVTAEINLTGLSDDGNFDWNIKCYDNSSNFGWAAANWTFNINEWYTESTTFLLDFKPAVNLTYPSDNAVLGVTSALFTFNVTETFGLLNCSLYHNITSWGIVETNVTASSGNNSFTVSNLADDTNFEWNIVCYDTRASKAWGNGSANRSISINLWYTENVSFKIDRPPVINWTTPSNLNESIFNRTYGFAQNVNVTDYALKEMNCTIYSDVNLTKAMWSVSLNITGYKDYVKTSLVNTSNWESGVYYEKCIVTDVPV